ncbi:MAG: PadR family transcriptional regulator [Thermoplasmata archaeon]|nr:PadR family transcriptional regulator [Thermoplasmata archaeon]
MFPFPWLMRKRRGLRMWIVSLLSSSPKNGAELMKEIESSTRGWWRPSPGSVYPLLEQLSKEGLIERREDGRYELTEKTTARLESSFWPAARRPMNVDEMVAEIEGYVSYFEDLNRSDRTEIASQEERLKDLEKRIAALARAKEP